MQHAALKIIHGYFSHVVIFQPRTNSNFGHPYNLSRTALFAQAAYANYKLPLDFYMKYKCRSE